MIIIPARLKSSRLNNKLLLPLGGIPIIVRVANIAKEVDSCIVACDDEMILEVCKKHNIECMLTSTTHESGTDRCAEVASLLNIANDEVIVNLQGDEPFIEPYVISSVKDAMEKHLEDTFITSCYKEIDSNEAQDSNLVKVVLDSSSYGIYFSRSIIPFDRDKVGIIYKGHLGIYAFSKKTLLEFCKLPKAPLECVEKLEQLRALWYGKKIFMVGVESKSIGIDTQSDYENAIKLIQGEKK